MGKYDYLISEPFHYHRYIDEAGDMTFFGKGGVPIASDSGASKLFMLGLVKYKSSLTDVRTKIIKFTKDIESDPYFNTIPSVQKRIVKTGSYYFHAKDDIPELRYKFFDFMKNEIDFTLQVVVGRKDLSRFVNKHNRKESAFYADLLTRLLFDKGNYPKLVLNVAQLGSSTRVENLQEAATKAKLIFERRNSGRVFRPSINFNVQPYVQEPLLSVVDYGLWSVQRVYERGETRFYDSILEKVRFVEDIYDIHNSKPSIYNPHNPLTSSNKL